MLKGIPFLPSSLLFLSPLPSRLSPPIYRTMLQSSRSITALSQCAHNRNRLIRAFAVNGSASEIFQDQTSQLYCPRFRCSGRTTRLLHNTRCTFNKSTNNVTSPMGDAAIQSVDDDTLTSSETSALSESWTDVPGTTNTKAKTLAIIYTCKVCDTRSAKQFTEHSYRHGVVLVRCPGCQNLHLIADRLGWFEDSEDDGKGWDVEKALAKAGENVKAVSHGDVLELTLDDIVGTKKSSD